MSYYQHIGGEKYDRALIEAAKEAVAGRGDGRISQADAERLLTFVTDGGTITAVERATVVYLRENFTWTDKADAWFQAVISGDAPAAPSAPAAPRRRSKKTTAIILRIGKAYKTGRYFPADAAAQAQDSAIVMFSQGTPLATLDDIFARTKPHIVNQLPHEVEQAFTDTGVDLINGCPSAFASVLGWSTIQIGFDSVSTDALISVMEGLGFHIVEGENVLG